MQATRQAYAGDPRFAEYAAPLLLSNAGSPQELAARYVLTGQAGYAQDAINCLMTQTLTYGGEGSASVGLEWALAYDWTANLMTPAQQSAVEAKLRSWCYSCLTNLSMGGGTEWESAAQLACQAWVVSLALPHNNSLDNTLRASFWNLWQDALRAIDLCEGWPEGPGYWASNRAIYFPMAYEAWQTAVLSNPPFAVADPLRPIRTLGLWQMYTDRGDGSLERYGDVSGAASYAGNGTLTSPIDYYATVTRDPLLAAYREYARVVRPSITNYYEPAYYWRWGFAYDPSVPKPEGFSYADPAATLNAVAPKSQMFGQNALGLAVIRTGWGTGHTTITYKAGDYLSRHGHCDQGTFTIFKNAPLVVNMGGYGDDTGSHRLNYYVRTVGKNSILVMRPGETFPQDGAGSCANDGGQRLINVTGASVTGMGYWLANKTAGKHYETADIKKYEHIDGQYTYVDSDLTNAYNNLTYDRGNTGGKVTQVTRQVLWLADKQALVVFDRVSSTNASYKKKWLLHTPNKPFGGADVVRLGSDTNGLMVVDGTTIPDNMLISTNGNGKLYHQVLLPASYEVNKVGGSNYRYYVETDGSDDNGYNGSNQDGGYMTPQWYHDAGDWRIEVTPKARQVSDTFLNVLWPRDGATASVPVSQVLRNDAVATVMQAGDAVVGFGTSGVISGDLAYSLDAAGPTTHRLVDMAADATYWVLCGYGSLQQVQAGSQGVLRFTDPVSGLHGVTISRNPLHLPADGNQDGSVDVVDLLTLVGAFGTSAGQTGYNAAADANADGAVDVVDLLIFVEAFGASQVPQGSYSRTGTACMDGNSYAPDVPRIRRLPVASVTDCQLMNSLVCLLDGAPATSLSPECSMNGTLVLRNDQNGHVYGYTGGWQLARLTSVPPALYGIFATSAGTLVGFCPSTGGFKRSVDGGRTWSVSAMLGGNSNAFSSTTAPLPYTCIEAAGCLWAGEYGCARPPYPGQVGRYVWRSTDDGVTWQPVLDGATIQPDPTKQWSHIHGIGYHRATGRLIVTSGDGWERAQVWYTDNPAAAQPTWVKMYANWGEERAQPMTMLDFGDPSRLLFGDDENRGLGYLDVLTGTVTNAMPVTDGRFPHNLYWHVFQVDGVFYALSADSSADDALQTILASRDGMNWVIHARLPARYSIVRWFGGVTDGRLHIGCSSPDGSWHWFALPPAHIEDRDAVLLEPGVTNLIAGAAGQFDDDSHGWTCNGQIMARDLGDGYGPGSITACLTVTANVIPTPGTTTLTVRSPLVGGMPGTQYGASVWMRTTTGSMPANLQMVDETGAAGPECQYFVDSVWREYRALPLEQAALGRRVSLQVRAFPTPASTQIRIDNAQVAPLPITQVQYAGPRGDDSWQYAASVGERWANTFTIAPEVLAWQLPPEGRLLVRRWQSDEGNYLDLAYNVSARTFELSAVLDGVAAGTAATAPIFWHPASRLRFSIFCSQADATLTVTDANAPIAARLVFSPSGQDPAALVGTTLTVKAFSPGNGVSLLPHYLFRDLDTWDSDQPAK